MPQATEEVLGRLDSHIEKLKSGDGKVQPGEPAAFTTACVAGDCIHQGDLSLIVRDDIPAGYELAKEPSVRLVPGPDTQGARHVLDSLDRVEIFLHKDWSPTYEGIAGPILKAKDEVKVLHPVHGDVTIPGGTIIDCQYQREWDAEQRRERRNAD